MRLTYLIAIIRSVRRHMILRVGSSGVSIVSLSSVGDGLSVSCLLFWVLRRLVCVATRLALLLHLSSICRLVVRGLAVPLTSIWFPCVW